MICFRKCFLYCGWVLNFAISVNEIIVIQDAPKSKRMLHCSIQVLQLLKLRLFVWTVLYRVIQYVKRDSRYVGLNYQYLFTFVWVCVCSNAEMFLEFDFRNKKWLVYMGYIIGFGKTSFLFQYFEVWSDLEWSFLPLYLTHTRGIQWDLKNMSRTTVVTSLSAWFSIGIVAWFASTSHGITQVETIYQRFKKQVT